MDTELRWSVANLGMCFLSGSIAGAAIRSNLSAEHANMLRQKLLISLAASTDRRTRFVFQVLF